MFHCLVIKVLHLPSCDSSFILSHSQLFVKNFLTFFFSKLSIQEVLKRRRRDLNPRAAINDLLPFQGSPFGQLGYFSKLPYAIALVYFFTRSVLYYIALFFFCQELFRLFQNLFILNKRREWDSNPRALADKRFSRPPRYDHFDISPYSLFSVFCASLSAQDIFYHRTSHMSTPKFTFFYIFSKKFLQHQDLLVL